MMMRIACWIGLFLISSIGLLGQNTATDSYKQEPLTEQGFEASAWEDMRKNMRYEDQKPFEQEEETEEQEDESPTESVDVPDYGEPADFSGLAQFLLITLSIIVVAGVLYWMITNGAFKKNTEVKRIQVESLEEAERDLDKADIKSFLEKAIANGDYRLALRLYYLQSIKVLSAKYLIVWKRDKTNGRYLRELKGHDLYPDFKSLTLDFERIWYTDMPVSEDLFSKQHPAFEQFLQKVGSVKKAQ